MSVAGGALTSATVCDFGYMAPLPTDIEGVLATQPPSPTNPLPIVAGPYAAPPAYAPIRDNRWLTAMVGCSPNPSATFVAAQLAIGESGGILGRRAGLWPNASAWGAWQANTDAARRYGWRAAWLDAANLQIRPIDEVRASATFYATLASNAASVCSDPRYVLFYVEVWHKQPNGAAPVVLRTRSFEEAVQATSRIGRPHSRTTPMGFGDVAARAALVGSLPQVNALTIGPLAPGSWYRTRRAGTLVQLSTPDAGMTVAEAFGRGVDLLGPLGLIDPSGSIINLRRR